MVETYTPTSSQAPTPQGGGSTATSSAETFTPAQQIKMAEWAVADGHLTREQANDALKGDGIEPPEKPNPTSAAAEIDAQFPAAEMHEFDFTIPTSLWEGRDPSLVSEADAITRGILYDARFDRERGNSFMREIFRVVEATGTMTPAELELYRRSEQLKLEKIWGNETQAKLDRGRALAQQLGERYPGFLNVLNQFHAGDSALVTSMMVAQAEILLARQGIK